MNMLKMLKLADFLTIGNLCCGVLAIMFSFTVPSLAASFLFAAVLFDLLDGAVAKLLHQSNEFGKQLDSLADIVSFGVAPVALFFAIGPRATITSVILLLFVACGMLRLARYNISTSKGFEGVPITVNGAVFPALYVLWLVLPSTINLWPYAFLVMAFLMVSSIRVRRLI